MPELMRRLIGGGLEEGSFLHFALTNRRSVTILGAFLMLPGCFSRSLSRLSWSSFMTVCAITVAVIFVLISFFHHTDCISCSSYQSVMKPRPLWWAVQGVVCFCFTFQRVRSNKLVLCSVANCHGYYVEIILCVQLSAQKKSEQVSLIVF